MRKAQCTNSHFFDADTYSVCPHCGAPAMSIDPQIGGISPEPPKQKSSKFKMPFFGGHKNAPAPAQPQMTNEYPQPDALRGVPSAFPGVPHTENGRGPSAEAPVNPFQQQNRPAAPPPVKNYQNPQPAQAQNAPFFDTPHTVSIHRANAAQIEQPQAEAPSPVQPVKAPKPAPPPVNIGYEPPVSAPTPAPALAVQQSAPPQTSAPQRPAAPAVQEQQNSGKTIGFFNGGESSCDPVVGWLVCLKGANLGMSYQLAAKKNTIGRLYGNDVVLENEPKVSRESHAIISYDYKKSDFYLLPSNGDSSYVNDEMLLAPCKLKRFDKIEIGGCLLLFVPLCGEDFSWSDYINEE